MRRPAISTGGRFLNGKTTTVISHAEHVIYAKSRAARLRRATAYRYRVWCPPLLPCPGKQAWRRSLTRRNRERLAHANFVEDYHSSGAGVQHRDCDFHSSARRCAAPPSLLQPQPLLLSLLPAFVRHDRAGSRRCRWRARWAQRARSRTPRDGRRCGRWCARGPRDRPDGDRAAALPLLSLRR
jgi:hypothetical protein